MILLKVIFTVFLAQALAYGALYDDINPQKLKNDKEPLATVLQKGETAWLKSHYSLHQAQSLFHIFEKTLKEFNHRQKACDLGFMSILDEELAKEGVREKDYLEFFSMMRAFNQIDDIFHDILSNGMSLRLRIKDSLSAGGNIPHNNRIFTPRSLKQNNVEELFGSFVLPDEDSSCALGEFYTLVKSVKGGTKARDLEALAKEAYHRKVIDEKTYRTLEAIIDQNALAWPIYIGGYFDKIFNSKNTMQYSSPISLEDVENSYASQYQGRAKKITRRKELYYKYNPTQIIMLAQVLEKASIRMGVDPTTETSTPRVEIDYVVQRDGREESYTDTYYLSPSEQFEYARKRLRMDMLELSGTKTFRGMNIEAEDIIMAALETGYISHHDLEYVVKYDDLWNPKISSWKKARDFIWSFAGTASFFLPPPWNVIGAVGLVFVNSKTSKGKKAHESHENPANIFN